MPRTDAQKRALNNYRKKTKQIIIRFYPNDEDEKLYEWIKSQENVTEYIKGLVKGDMEKQGASNLGND